MQFFKKYLFPGLYGLLIYFTVRVLHDVVIGEHFWRRSWRLNFIEMGFSLFTGYMGIWMFNSLFNYFDRKRGMLFTYRNFVRELLIFIGANLLLVNIILTPMAAFTDDGLSWADMVDICVVPTLYAFVYYGIARSRTYLTAYVDNKVQLEKVTNDHLQTELKFLKSQYHPHFLFNALNTIYFQMDEDISAAKKSIEQFSELLRYQLYDQQQQVPISNELEYLQSFIDLQKVRSSDKLKLNVSFDNALDGQLVYPLLFLPLVENAFKFIGGDYNLLISAKLINGQIIFKVENSVPDFESPAIHKGGIGLENLRRRLDLLYPDKYTFATAIEPNTFKAELVLNYE